ncbi:MAG: hypothetical protein PWQ25_767, partial [Deferribacteres bacterium]|nr:hypothetical protein [Deferribacteres bacterium]
MRVIIYLFIFFVIIQHAYSQETVIRFSHVVSENSPKGKAAVFFKNLVEEKSNGKIKVYIYPRGIL